MVVDGDADTGIDDLDECEQQEQGDDEKEGACCDAGADAAHTDHGAEHPEHDHQRRERDHAEQDDIAEEEAEGDDGDGDPGEEIPEHVGPEEAGGDRGDRDGSDADCVAKRFGGGLGVVMHSGPTERADESVGELEERKDELNVVR